MDDLHLKPLMAVSIGLVISVVLTFIVRSAAVRFGYVAKPKADRWHKRPTALLGGISIFLTTIAVFLATAPLERETLFLLGSSSFLFLVGFVDDLFNIKPYQKLIGQLIGAGILLFSGMRLPLTGYELVDIWITLFWIIGITNAVNLLDNMDGLAAGISAIAAFSLAMNFSESGLANETILMAALIGALVGFLVFNFNPASVFMGDCGSMFVGFLLSGTVLLNQVGGRSRGIVAILAVPVLILFVPIFDTTFVTVLRKLWGRKASQGGRDHTSHRLVALGLSERKAVLMLYAFATVSGGLAIAVGQIGPAKSFSLIGFFIATLVLIGVYLSRVKVYEAQQEEQAVRDHAGFAFLLDVSHKRRIFEVFLDAFLITLAYYSAFAAFRMFENQANWGIFLKTLPLLILVKLGAFLLVGVYRGIWRYTSIDDIISITKGVFLGSAFCVLALLIAYRFQGFSRTVFILDALFLLIAVIGSRMAFRVIRQMLPFPVAGEGRRILIYGAGDGGEMLLRELNNNPEWNYLPVGFIDDDPLKKDKVIHGLRVFDGNGTLAEICREKEVEEILISVRNISPEKLRYIREVCADNDVVLKRALLKIEPVDIV